MTLHARPRNRGGVLRFTAPPLSPQTHHPSADQQLSQGRVGGGDLSKDQVMTYHYTDMEMRWLVERAMQEQNATVPASVDSRGQIIWGTDFKRSSAIADTTPSDYTAPDDDCA